MPAEAIGDDAAATAAGRGQAVGERDLDRRWHCFGRVPEAPASAILTACGKRTAIFSQRA